MTHGPSTFVTIASLTTSAGLESATERDPTVSTTATAAGLVIMDPIVKLLT